MCFYGLAAEPSKVKAQAPGIISSMTWFRGHGFGSETNVSRETPPSLADAKFGEDHVQKILDIDPSGQPPQLAGRHPEILGY